MRKTSTKLDKKSKERQKIYEAEHGDRKPTFLNICIEVSLTLIANIVTKRTVKTNTRNLLKTFRYVQTTFSGQDVGIQIEDLSTFQNNTNDLRAVLPNSKHS